MATNFIYPDIEDKEYVLTSSVSSIQATTDKDHLDVSLMCESGLDDEPEVFFSTSLYAFNDVVELADVGSLIEEYFRKRNKVADRVSVIFDNVSMDVHFLYCENTMPDSFDHNSCFFTTSHVQCVHQDSIISLSAVNRGEAVQFKIIAAGNRKTNGDISIVSFPMQQLFNREDTVYFAVPDIIRHALNMTDQKVEDDLADILYFAIEYGSIRKTCYLEHADAYLTFSFRNIFNVEEFIDVVGTMTAKTEVSRDIAVCNGLSKQYNRAVERTFRVMTAPLDNSHVAALEQFIASHRVALYHEGQKYDVVITDHTCEPSNDDESLNTISFTWQFAGQRPHIFDHFVNGIMPTRRKIFDDSFSLEYE